MFVSNSRGISRNPHPYCLLSNQLRRLGLFFAAIGFIMFVNGCGSDDSLDLDMGQVSQKNALVSETCERVCDTETVCETVYDCHDATHCGWQWYWSSTWWGGYYWPSYECTTSRECTPRQDCHEKQTNCRDVCRKEAFPKADEVALLDAINYWSSSEIASSLGVVTSVAESIYQGRIDNGGVYFSLDEIHVTGFEPQQHKSNAIVQASKDIHSLLAPQVAYNNNVQILIDGRDQLDMIVGLIDSATKYIHLNMMLFFNDPGADNISHALKRAAQRGVILRVMFDTDTTILASNARDSGAAVAGTPITPGLGAKSIIESGCQPGVVCSVRSTSQETEFFDHDWYDSLGWFSDSVRADLKDSGVPEYMLQMQDYIQDSVETAKNVVNHQKYMIVDGSKMMIGSSNFGVNYQYEESFEPGEKWRWHDGMALVEGPLGKHAQRIFAQQWFVNARGDIFDYDSDFYFGADSDLVSSTGTTPMALLMSFPGDPKHLNIRYIEEMLRNATSNVYIENPYVTDGSLWDALNSLDVTHASRTHLVTPIGLTDAPTVGYTVRCRGKGAATRGLRVYDYYGGERFSHLKLAVDTSKSMVHYGSYNLNMRSKRHDLELNFLARDPELADQMKRVVQYDISKSIEKAVGYYFNDPYTNWECLAEEGSNWFT